MDKLIALVVTYNSTLADSRTLQTLDSREVSEIWIADNSTKDMGNAQYAEDHGYQYVNMGGNFGLSKAYNAVIDRIEYRNSVLCLFDDDTCLSADYFTKLRQVLLLHPEIDVFVPLVYDGLGLLSPCRINGATTRRLKNRGNIPPSGISAINSGMAVRTAIYQSYRYDEGLFLDFVDHAFLKDRTNHELAGICIFESKLDQDFSGSQKNPFHAAWERYKIYHSDIDYYCKKYSIPGSEKLWLKSKRKIRIVINAAVHKISKRGKRDEQQ